MTVDQIEAAAKMLAQCMGYPWNNMPEQGRNSMRKHAQAVVAAALPAAAALVSGEDERTKLLAIIQTLSLATDDCDDIAQGTHYIGKDGRIHCKGSFLDLIERARAALRTPATKEAK